MCAMSGKIKIWEKYDFWKWTLSILGFISTLLTPLIDEKSGELNIEGGYLRFLIIFISVLVAVVPWILSWKKQLTDLKSNISTIINTFSEENVSLHSKLEDVTSLVTAAKDMNINATNITEKINEMAIWRKNEQEDKIKITVSDLDDYLILLPLHLSMRYLKGLDVKIETRSCGSDKKAIEKLLSGKSDFAITDPYYLKEYHNPDLVLLAPLITKTPMWWMSREKSGGEIIRIFSYETINEQDTHDTYTSRLLKEQINKLGLNGGKYTIVTIKEVVEELCQRLDNGIKHSRREETLISSYVGQKGAKGLTGIREDIERITAFECLLFSCVENSDIDKRIRNITTEYFQSFDFFLVTEPDCSFIRDVLGYKADQVVIDDMSFFTGIITTRKHMREFPVASLKMLRGIRDGILMSNIVLMREDTQSIKKAFEDALIAVSKDQKAQLFKKALESIKKFELDATFFPNDLVILDTDKSYVEKDSYYISMIDKYKKSDYGDSILRTKVVNGKPADLKDPDIKFIIEGLGYDC